MKTFRVDRIFHSENPSFQLPDWKLGLHVGVLVLFEVVFLLVGFLCTIFSLTLGPGTNNFSSCGFRCFRSGVMKRITLKW